MIKVYGSRGISGEIWRGNDDVGMEVSACWGYWGEKRIAEGRRRLKKGFGGVIWRENRKSEHWEEVEGCSSRSS